jgi:hypothetical protein
MITLSFGGGVQSAAIVVLIAQGRLPRPDQIVMADTGREARETWDYLEAHIVPLLAPLGLMVQVIPHDYATVDLYAGNGDVLIPAYTNGGKLPTFCSDKWKKLPVRRWLKAQGVTETTMWLGMSLDEIERMRISDVKWITNHYPLVYDVRLRRHECAKLVEDYGLPTPPKSSCWMCPHRRNDQWRRLRAAYPQDWQQAVALDRQITASHGVYLHESRQPLEEANIEAEVAEASLFDLCASGYCMV